MVNEIDIVIGKRLRRRRLQLGMSQHDIAASVGVRFQQIQKYECGVNRIAASRLWKMAQVMETPITYFFDRLVAEREQGGEEETAQRRCG